MKIECGCLSRYILEACLAHTSYASTNRVAASGMILAVVLIAWPLEG